MVAVLYRTNAQSRAIEDALMRAGMAYRVVGGVRFYERREVKDSLAYLKVIINPHDDVSLRRIINVPARGIGKGVLDGLVSLPPPAALPPLLAVGLDPAISVNSLWTRLLRAIDERLLPARALASLAAFRDLIVSLTDVARRDPVSIALGKMLDQSGYLGDLREERSEEAEGRVENLMELVSAAREYENRDPEASIGGFVDQLSLLSDIDEAQGAADARIWLMTMHSAKGLEFPVVFIAGMEEGLFPHSRSRDDEAELEEERRLVLRGHDPGTHAPGAHERGPAPRVRRLPVHRAVAVPRRDPAGADRAGGRLRRGGTGLSSPALRVPDEPVRTGRPRQAAAPAAGRMRRLRRFATRRKTSRRRRPSGRVRGSGTRSSGSGTVISVEHLDDDARLVVRFAIGQKTLRAKFAKLEMA